MSKTEQLHPCPKCQTPNFTARGLQAHKCKGIHRAGALQATSLANPEVTACVARFRALQGALKQSVLGTKLLKYFLGLEVKRLCALHGELHGEQRGGDVKSDDAKIKTDSLSVLVGPWLENQLGVTERSCYRYRNFFESLTTSNANEATVKKLNAWWNDWQEKTTAQLLTDAKAKKGKGSALALSDSAAALLAESDLKTILDHPDEWGLHELFEEPLKDVTPQDDDSAEDDDNAADRKHKLIKFWCGDLLKRLGNNEFLRLPKPQLETLTTELEEALHKAKDRLKPATKGGKRK